MASHYYWANNGSWVGILGILTKVAFHNYWVGILGILGGNTDQSGFPPLSRAPSPPSGSETCTNVKIAKFEMALE